jgi:hypothetical protein
MRRIVAIASAVVLLPVFAMATPYIPPEEAMSMESGEAEFVIGRGMPSVFDYEYDPLNRFQMCADFITTLQVSDTASINYGGMREGEHLPHIIQTDNTSESIWIWTHYYALTGDDAYHDNTDAAWEYCMNFPAYDEEGGSGLTSGYYRVYNCAWAVRAEMEYRDVYGDTSYAWYADSCASYLCHNPLMLRYPVGMYRKLNGLVMGWAVGNLYEYGDYVGDTIFMSKAVDMADSLKSWAEGNPNKFHWKQWAMEGGSVMWGIVNSYFREYPSDLVTWTETYAPYMDTEVDSSEYQNAWRGWAALGQYTASEVLDSPVYAGYFKHLADTLVLNDGDADGGIPVIDPEPDNRDQTWVTNYLGFMCMDKLLTISGLASRDRTPVRTVSAEVTPVPSYGPPDLRFMLSDPCRVSVEVLDVAGRIVYTRDMGLLGRGPHTVPLLAGSREVESAPGVYFYLLRSGENLESGKLVVLR